MFPCSRRLAVELGNTPSPPPLSSAGVTGEGVYISRVFKTLRNTGTREHKSSSYPLTLDAFTSSLLLVFPFVPAVPAPRGVALVGVPEKLRGYIFPTPPTALTVELSLPFWARKDLLVETRVESSDPRKAFSRLFEPPLRYRRPATPSQALGDTFSGLSEAPGAPQKNARGALPWLNPPGG